MPDLGALRIAIEAEGLEIAGIVAEGQAPMPPGQRSIVLLSPGASAFWPVFTASAEYRDGQADPMDRWSMRVIGALAKRFGALACYPFAHTPPQPFPAWALASGQAWSSPVRLLVGARAGLWASFRGALAFARAMQPLPVANCPCTDCPQPCATACPVGALSPSGYDGEACQTHLRTAQGQDCLTRGCAARRSCPVSDAYPRDPAQSEFHMRYFTR